MAKTKIQRDWEAMQAHWDYLLAKSVGMTTDELNELEEGNDDEQTS